MSVATCRKENAVFLIGVLVNMSPDEMERLVRSLQYRRGKPGQLSSLARACGVRCKVDKVPRSCDAVRSHVIGRLRAAAMRDEASCGEGLEVLSKMSEEGRHAVISALKYTPAKGCPLRLLARACGVTCVYGAGGSRDGREVRDEIYAFFAAVHGHESAGDMISDD